MLSSITRASLRPSRNLSTRGEGPGYPRSGWMRRAGRRVCLPRNPGVPNTRLPVWVRRTRRLDDRSRRYQSRWQVSAEGQGGQESAWRLMVGPGEGVTEGGILAGEKQPEVDHVLRQEVLVLPWQADVVHAGV